jgi:hypothetical protein
VADYLYSRLRERVWVALVYRDGRQHVTPRTVRTSVNYEKLATAYDLERSVVFKRPPEGEIDRIIFIGRDRPFFARLVSFRPTRHYDGDLTITPWPT